MSSQFATSDARRAKFHHYGPWILGGGVVLGALAYELVRRHEVTRFEVIYFLVLIPTIILHEVAHGLVAHWCGDDTAKRAGRLTLNPLRHIDPLGSIVVPILLLAWGAPAFGWAKPVPVNVSNLRRPRNQSILVSLAGPFTNVIIAVGAGFAFRFAVQGIKLAPNPSSWPVVDVILFVLGEVNVIIAVFNLIPIPPLDGSVILERFLPRTWLPGYYRLRMFSMVLVLVVVLWFPGALDALFNRAITYWLDVISI